MADAYGWSRRTAQPPNVGPVERALSAALGVMMLRGGLARWWRGGRISGTAALAGSGLLLWRGWQGRSLVYEVLGIERAGVGGRDGIRVDESVTVAQAPDVLHRAWRSFADLVGTAPDLEDVRETDAGSTHWQVRGPLGLPIEWDAEITEERPGALIAWRSTGSALVRHAGAVQFRPAPGGRGTWVRVTMSYAAPGGSLGAAAARLLRHEPALQVRSALRRFKQAMEAGEIATIEGQPRGGKLPALQGTRERPALSDRRTGGARQRTSLQEGTP